MRNWNSSCKAPARCFAWRFDLTYEELKLSIFSFAKLYRNRFDLTYEELKLVKTTVIINVIAVLILPMRNWNIKTSLSRVGVSGFDLTYEELKLPVITGSNETSLTGFDLTYEELKHFSQKAYTILFNSFWSYLWGIETNLLMRKKKKAYRVLILPMRNWNPKDPLPKDFLFFVLILPMRNWNLYMHRLPTLALSRFDLTYEELKL